MHWNVKKKRKQIFYVIASLQSGVGKVLGKVGVDEVQHDDAVLAAVEADDDLVGLVVLEALINEFEGFVEHTDHLTVIATFTECFNLLHGSLGGLGVELDDRQDTLQLL